MRFFQPKPPKEEPQMANANRRDDRTLTKARVAKVLKDMKAIEVSGKRADLSGADIEDIFKAIARANIKLNKVLSGTDEETQFDFKNDTHAESLGDA